MCGADRWIDPELERRGAAQPTLAPELLLQPMPMVLQRRLGIGDVLLVDVTMPDIDGITMLGMLREQGNPVPVIVMSAQNTMLTAIPRRLSPREP